MPIPLFFPVGIEGLAGKNGSVCWRFLLLPPDRMTTLQNGFEQAKATALPAQDRMNSLQLTYVNLNYFHSKKTTALLNLIAEKMEKECGLGEGYLYDLMLLCKNEKVAKASGTFSHTHGFFLLHDGKELLCASYLNWTRIITRWTPPKHRGKGYAGDILRGIEQCILLLPTTVLPLWVCSYERMNTINARVGWEMNPDINTANGCGDVSTTDGTHDWYPPSMRERYIEAGRFDRKEMSKAERDAYYSQAIKDWQVWLRRYGGSVNLDLKVKI